MAAKGTIKADKFSVNKFELLVVGLPIFTVTKVSGLEEELEVAELPDRTRVTGGNTKGAEFTATMPLHHTIEQVAMELWFKEGQDPVSPLYKKPVTLLFKSDTGRVLRSFTMAGVFPRKRALPELDMKAEGEAVTIMWTFSYDEIMPV